MKTTFQTIDEVGWLAVRLPADATPFGAQTFVAITTIADPRSHLILSRQHGLPFFDRFDLISHLCDDRAQMAVDGQLHCRGAVVTPEQYVAKWRRALAASQTPQELYDGRGWSLVVRLEGPWNDPNLLQRKSAWICCPFQTFAVLSERHASRIRHTDDRFAVDIDLAEPDGPRNAYYADSMLMAALGSDGAWRTRLTLVHDESEGGDPAALQVHATELTVA